MEDKKAEINEIKSDLNDRELEAAAGGVSEELAFHDCAPLMWCWACHKPFTPYSLPQQKDGRCLDCYTTNRKPGTQTHYVTNPRTTFIFPDFLPDFPDKKE